MSSDTSSNPIVHKVFLIRHGETVDNVAGLYAGTRDSALTNHGVIQASRLGEYFAQDGVRFTHLFSSTLSRAAKTAEAILKAQLEIGSPALDETLGGVEQLNDLMEQDFGSLEGKPYAIKTRDENTTATDGTVISDKDTAFVAVESKESMARRASRFLDGHLNPILKRSQSATVAIVSHGMLLSSLWRCILKQQSPSSVTLSSELLSENPPVSLEHLGGWMNTGYLELEILCDSQQGPFDIENPAVQTASDHSGSLLGALGTRVENEEKNGSNSLSDPKPPLIKHVGDPPRISVKILAINGKQHLRGLKRTRGGVGSSRHDSTQQTINSFFKKPKTS